jgi:hypothetical protein
MLFWIARAAGVEISHRFISCQRQKITKSFRKVKGEMTGERPGAIKINKLKKLLDKDHALIYIIHVFARLGFHQGRNR